MARRCPKCAEQALASESFEGVEIDRCPSCRGILLDHGEMSALFHRKAGLKVDQAPLTPVSEVMDAEPAHCYTCDQRMNRVLAPGDIHVDSCPVCRAVFLDEGELGTLQRARS